MKIIIVFIGLVVHVNQPWSLDNTAVLPYGNAQHGTLHKATIEIPIDGIENAPDELRLAVAKAGQTHVIRPLKELDVRVEGTRGYYSRMSRDLLEALPALKDLAPGCRLRRDVRDRTQSTKLASFIDYRGGRRVPDSYLDKKLTFPGTKWINRCVVCGVRYEADLRGPTATLSFTNASGHVVETFKLKPGTEVVVRNIATEPGFGHFVHAFDIYEEGCHFQAPVRPDKPCSRALCINQQLGEKYQEGETSPGEDCTGGNGP